MFQYVLKDITLFITCEVILWYGDIMAEHVFDAITYSENEMQEVYEHSIKSTFYQMQIMLCTCLLQLRVMYVFNFYCFHFEQKKKG